MEVAGAAGVAQDDVLVNREWDFDPAGVQPRIDIWHGDADVNVPVHAATYLHEVLPLLVERLEKIAHDTK